MSAGRTLSRRSLARFVAEKLESGKVDDVIEQAAAYMIETKQKHSIELLVRDIEAILAEQGTVIADVTSARALSQSDKDRIAGILNAKKLHVRETIDPTVLGGLKIEAAGRRLDATLKHKIDSLKEIDSRKGTS